MANAYFYNNLRSAFHHFLLLFLTESGIFYPYLQIQVPGLEPREMLQATYDAPASFFMSCARLYLNGGLGGGTVRCAGCL
ncbi:hypothetical protein ABP79_00160 [Salmonella enterica subsp. enterica]|nr:hypothetical protein [Salmonella enterica subsp. enterica serovar Schwarzengrund]EBS4960246.1 hypothetical protein [Salmonella enterica subsp. enterica serovar Amsterdam]MKP00643.1 hypothetical protein [Salmonella enterica subsp. enterica serovar Schwarzengrund]